MTAGCLNVSRRRRMSSHSSTGRRKARVPPIVSATRPSKCPSSTLMVKNGRNGFLC
jgi:hypothetical protein